MPRTPRYRINTVSEMTGIPASTLRAWERRHGVPSPQRTSSAYRMYSDEDVDLLRRMRELVEGGVAPSEAAGLLLAGTSTPEPEPRETPGPFAEAVQRIVSAVEAFDPVQLRAEVARASYLAGAVSVYEHVLSPAMQTIGQRWHDGTLSVGQEHLASEVLIGAARDLHRMLQTDGGERLALLACFAGEQHVLPLYGVACRLAGWGFRSEILGANTPPSALGAAVDAMRPHLVGLSLTMPYAEEIIHPLLDEYVMAIAGRPWMVGGASSARYEARIQALGGLVAGPELSSLRGPVERALLGPRGLREVAAS